MNFITQWSIDPDHSDIEFKIRHLLISQISGSFKIFNGKMTTDTDNFETANIVLSIDVYSFDTNNIERDEHIKSKDFLDADQFPEINFTSKSFEKVDGDNYKLTGNLTIKGVTREILLDAVFGGQAKDGFGKMKAGFEISGKIDRNDFGILSNDKTETGNLIIGDEIKIHANIEFDKEED
jgi:polyisoprenoid-binding protein YceI